MDHILYSSFISHEISFLISHEENITVYIVGHYNIYFYSSKHDTFDYRKSNILSLCQKLIDPSVSFH